MKRLLDGLLPIVGLGGLLLVSLLLLSDATQNSARFGQLYSLLLVVTVLGLVTLLALIGLNLARLLRQVRERRAGARLTVRMVATFSLLAVTPVLVVYYFSVTFLRAGIDSWFDVRIESALSDALELGRTSLGVRMREMLKQTELIAQDLASVADDQAPVLLDEVRRRTDATEMMLMGARGHIIASSSIDPTAIVPNRPSDTTVLQVRQTGPYIGLEPVGELGLHVRVAVALPEVTMIGEPRILHALYPITERLNSLAESVQGAYAKYRELAFLRKPLKASFTLTLSLVLLLSLLTAVWAAFYSARRLVAPLRDLSEGTRAVAEGDYGTQLQPESRDEVGFLVESFNDMSRRLALARDETRHSQQLVEAQRAYLETVLRRLSTGVLTLDAEKRLVTANQAAVQILGVELDAGASETLDDLVARHDHLAPLADTLERHVEERDGDWREQVVVFGASGRQVLMLSGAPLAGADGRGGGHLLVFDDLTTLIQAQKNAAWSEVARRLAHEIKNPLTPIQLSAERLRHKYMQKLDDDDSQVFDRLTRTIVQQVESMKAMVNTFSDYARSPPMELDTLDINELVHDVVELYRSGRGTVRAEVGEAVPELCADAGRLRQVLHNLIRNALDAVEDGGARVVVTTRSVHDAARRYVEVRISDDGPGFPADIVDHAFEPYVTTKPKGTGLGLAIVKKLVEEHGGVVWAENLAAGGAAITMRFPVSREADADTSPSPPPATETV